MNYVTVTAEFGAFFKTPSNIDKNLLHCYILHPAFLNFISVRDTLDSRVN